MKATLFLMVFVLGTNALNAAARTEATLAEKTNTATESFVDTLPYELIDGTFIDKRTRIKIERRLGAVKMPLDWAVNRKGSNSMARPLERKGLKQAVHVTIEAMSKYPTMVVKQNLGRVQLFSTLRIKGEYKQGMPFQNNVFITHSSWGGSGLLNVEQQFHQAFAAILFQAHADKFDQAAWDALAVAEYEKPEKPSRSYYDAKKYRAKGFFTQEAQQHILKDFGALACNLFVPQKDFWAVVEAEPLLAQKLDLVLAFYQQLDPKYTKAFFKDNSERAVQRLVEIDESLKPFRTKGSDVLINCIASKDAIASLKHWRKFTSATSLPRANIGMVRRAIEQALSKRPEAELKEKLGSVHVFADLKRGELTVPAAFWEAELTCGSRRASVYLVLQKGETEESLIARFDALYDRMLVVKARQKALCSRMTCPLKTK